jgi:hypothetical protein
MTERSLESYFADWETEAFGFGYGSGEEYTLAALKTFFATVGEGEPEDRQHCYDYKKLEAALTPTVAWLLINALCRWKVDVIEYGTSPRYAWLTEPGRKLKEFFALKSVDELVDICCADCGDNPGCGPDHCNCGPEGYEKNRVCPNPFFPRRNHRAVDG